MALVAAFGVSLAVPPAAQAKAHQYVLKHPSREHCKAHYLRKNKPAKVRGKYVRRVWCVHVPAKPPAAVSAPAPSQTPAPPARMLTPTFTIVSTLEGGGRLLGLPAYKTVSASVETFASGPGNGVAGVPVTITLADPVTGRALGTFTETSYGGSCAIEIGIAGGYWVLKGEAVASYPGCPIQGLAGPGGLALRLGAIEVPANGHSIEIRGSFAGNAQYAASTSQWELFV